MLPAGIPRGFVMGWYLEIVISICLVFREKLVALEWLCKQRAVQSLEEKNSLGQERVAQLKSPDHMDSYSRKGEKANINVLWKQAKSTPQS